MAKHLTQFGLISPLLRKLLECAQPIESLFLRPCRNLARLWRSKCEPFRKAPRFILLVRIRLGVVAFGFQTLAQFAELAENIIALAMLGKLHSLALFAISKDHHMLALCVRQGHRDAMRTWHAATVASGAPHAHVFQVKPCIAAKHRPTIAGELTNTLQFHPSLAIHVKRIDDAPDLRGSQSG